MVPVAALEKLERMICTMLCLIPAPPMKQPTISTACLNSIGGGTSVKFLSICSSESAGKTSAYGSFCLMHSAMRSVEVDRNKNCAHASYNKHIFCMLISV